VRRGLAILVALVACKAPPPATPQPIVVDAAPDAPPSELAAAIYAADWKAVDQLLFIPLAPDAEVALAKRWDAFVAAQPTPTAAYFKLAKQFGAFPPEHPLRGLLVTLAERAADAEVELARAATGPGGTWLHASLAARIAGGRPPRVAAANLVAATRPDLDFVPVPAVCNWVDGPKRAAGIRVEVVTAGLSCLVEPEQRTAKRRTFRARITGRVALRWTGGELALPVDVETSVDEAPPFTTATEGGARPETVRKLHAALTDALRQHWAEDALTAALAAKDAATAEHHLVLHAHLVAPAAPSAQLVVAMERYGVKLEDLR